MTVFIAAVIFFLFYFNCNWHIGYCSAGTIKPNLNRYNQKSGKVEILSVSPSKVWAIVDVTIDISTVDITIHILTSILLFMYR